MVIGLKKEQKEEVEHKDFCNDKFHELEMTTMKKTEEQSGLEAKIADTTNHLEADKEKIVQINAEIADTTVAIQSANADRVKESQDQKGRLYREQMAQIHTTLADATRSFAQ